MCDSAAVDDPYAAGAAGQIGAEFVPYLRALYGDDNVISSDIKAPPRLNNNNSNGHNNHQHQTHHQTRGVLFPSTCSGFVYCDVQDYDALTRVVLEQGIDTVVHLASLLSAIGEKNPQLALKVNCAGIQNVLEVARLHDLTVLAGLSHHSRVSDWLHGHTGCHQLVF